MWKRKSFFWIAIIFIIFGKINLMVYAADGEKEEERKKIIYFIYDDSGSMTGDLSLKEQYAVQMFCAMSNPQDEIGIYFTSQFNERDSKYSYRQNIENEKPKIYLNQSNKEDLFEKIKQIESVGQNTYFSSIIRAVNDIKDKSGEKWVVMFTDGEIEKAPNEKYDPQNMVDVADLNKKLKGLMNGTDVNLYFSSLSSQNVIEKDEKANIYVYEKIYGNGEKDENRVIDCILSATEVIYGKRKQEIGDKNKELDGENEIVTIPFDIPVSNLVLLIQSDKEEITIKDTDLLNHRLYDISAGNKNGKMPPYGFIAEYEINRAEYRNRDDYEISFYIPSNNNYKIDVYYTPMVEPALQIDGNVDGVKEGRYVEGGYNVKVEWLNPETGLKIDETADLLATEKCTLTIDGAGIDAFDWKSEYIGNAKKGESIFELDTSLGSSVLQRLTFEESLEGYELELGGAEDTFYYNRLDKREKSFWAEIHDNGVNITDESMKPVVKFYQNDVENTKIEGEIKFDSQMKRWNIYPVLKNPWDIDISGDFICDVSIVFEADYYEDPKEFREEIELKTGVEDGLFRTMVTEKISERKYVFPFIGDWVRVDYKWDDRELKENKLKERNVSWEIYQKGNLEERREGKWGRIYIPWKFSYLWNAPDKIVIETDAVYAAYGSDWKAGQPKEIDLEDMSTWVKIICWMIILVGFLVVGLFLYWLTSYAMVLRKGERLLSSPKVCRNAVEIWDFGNVEWKWEREKKKLLSSGYYFVTLSLPFYTGYQELKMRLYYRKGNFWMKVLGISEKDIEMYVEGSKLDMKNAYVAVGKIISVRDTTGDEICKIKIKER